MGAFSPFAPTLSANVACLMAGNNSVDRLVAFVPHTEIFPDALRI